MDPVAQGMEREQLEHLEKPQLNLLGQSIAKLAEYGQNASQNMTATFNSMTMQSWIRLVVVVGGYMLLRPYVLKIITKGAVKKMEEQDAKEKAEAKAAISPNQLRGKFDHLDEDSEEELVADGTGTNWGSRARVRQRTFLKNLVEAEEKRKQDEEDDKDIADLLED